MYNKVKDNKFTWFSLTQWTFMIFLWILRVALLWRWIRLVPRKTIRNYSPGFDVYKPGMIVDYIYLWTENIKFVKLIDNIFGYMPSWTNIVNAEYYKIIENYICKYRDNWQLLKQLHYQLHDARHMHWKCCN